MKIFDLFLIKPDKKKQKSVPSCRALHFESLENREMLSVGPLLYDFPDYLQSNWFEQLYLLYLRIRFYRNTRNMFHP
jgi:hypothetical protein